MTKILISGVPGTGKTTVAQRLQTSHGFLHTDMEANDFALRGILAKCPDSFLYNLQTQQNDHVISWGFGPFTDRASINWLLSHGYSMIWLDGDRVASFRAFMERENHDPVMECMYYGQMQMIVATGIVEDLKPRIVIPFTETGSFRSTKSIAQEIISLFPEGV